MKYMDLKILGLLIASMSKHFSLIYVFLTNPLKISYKKYSSLQMDKNHMIFKVTIPVARIIGHYKMNGNILILPIRGEGPANVTLSK